MCLVLANERSSLGQCNIEHICLKLLTHKNAGPDHAVVENMNN